MSKVIFEDRYSATGIPRPDENSCHECDAMGLFPCKVEELNKLACEQADNRLVIIGQVEKDGTPMANDGWLIVQCPTCKGTRKKPSHA